MQNQYVMDWSLSSVSPGILALQDGEEDAELEGMDDPGHGVELFRVPLVTTAEADHESVGGVLDLAGCHYHLKQRRNSFAIFSLRQMVKDSRNYLSW